MPTLEERGAESNSELRERLEKKSLELGITYSFSEYIEMMESYLLKLERRVARLEKSHNLFGEEVVPGQNNHPPQEN
ncbi:MAG TPA: hypothetical protein VJ936_09965 [Desulfobacteraceae bacterium]|nr:hypothetical protein [Desulfobacteraceae bacterium]